MSKLQDKEQIESLALFRDRIADVLPQLSSYQETDGWLIRWLRVKDSKCERAEVMFRKYLIFRQVQNVDQVLSWTAPAYIQDNFLFQVCGIDKEESTLGIIPFGKWNLKKGCQMGLKDDLLRYALQMVEMALAFLEYRTSLEKNGKGYYTFSLVADLEGFSLTQLASKEVIEIVAEAIREFEANYPECLSNIWIVNAAKLFEVLFGIMRPLVRMRTLEKVHIYGRNFVSWRKELLKFIHVDQLPSQYGGSITSVINYKASYGMDVELVVPGYEIFPESELTKVILQAGQSHSMPLSVSKGSKLSWNFRTEDFDLAFRFTFHVDPDKVDKKEDFLLSILFSCDHCDSHLHVQQGAYVAKEDGIYTLVLHNGNKVGGQPKTVHYVFKDTNKN